MVPNLGIVMPSEIDLATLAAQVERLQEAEAHRWSVSAVPDTLKVYATLTPAGSEGLYCLRLDFGEVLSSGPPSVTFCNPTTHEEGRACDWPKDLSSYFKHPPRYGKGWICSPWTREGRQHHSEWRSHGWTVDRAIWRVLTALQDIVDAPGAYSGRAEE